MSERSPIAVERIGQISVRALDLERAITFYRELLGIPFLFQIPNAAFFQCGAVRLMLAVPEAPEYDHPGSIVYYVVADLHHTADELRERGVRLEGEPHLVARMPDHELWMAFLRDSEGNLLALMTEVRE